MTSNQIAELIIIIAGIANILLVKWAKRSRKQLKVIRGRMHVISYRK